MHPDFQTYAADAGGPVTDVVASTLGPGGKPTWSGSNPLSLLYFSGEASLDTWFVDAPPPGDPMAVPDAERALYNVPTVVSLPLTDMGEGWTKEDVPGANWHFTTEVHADFVYEGGEVFTFQGDDDLWTFIGGELHERVLLRTAGLSRGPRARARSDPATLPS